MYHVNYSVGMNINIKLNNSILNITIYNYMEMLYMYIRCVNLYSQYHFTSSSYSGKRGIFNIIIE